jgi:hypothetical protein
MKKQEEELLPNMDITGFRNKNLEILSFLPENNQKIFCFFFQVKIGAMLKLKKNKKLI